MILKPINVHRTICIHANLRPCTASIQSIAFIFMLYNSSKTNNSGPTSQCKECSWFFAMRFAFANLTLAFFSAIANNNKIKTNLC